MAKVKGSIVQVLGGVVDVEFPAEQLPEIYEAIEVPRKDDEPLVLEVQKHLGDNWVRTVAMDATDGLQRGPGLCDRFADFGAGWRSDPGSRLQRLGQTG